MKSAACSRRPPFRTVDTTVENADKNAACFFIFEFSFATSCIEYERGLRAKSDMPAKTTLY
jgi:hypothetical protein